LTREPPGADEVARRLGAKGLEIRPGDAATLARFLDLLEHWNRVHNLTGTHDRAGLIDRHLAESLALGPLLAGPAIADIGSGAGLPGLPLAIVHPELRFTLIESRRKRVSFMRHAVLTLGLTNVDVAHGRVETLSLGPFATVLARAVAPPAELIALAEPLLEPQGRLVVLTSVGKAHEFMTLATGFAARIAGTEARGLESAVVVLERTLS
jgi:16S rRNA (guanine527-N7)-methyltransferase